MGFLSLSTPNLISWILVAKQLKNGDFAFSAAMGVNIVTLTLM